MPAVHHVLKVNPVVTPRKALIVAHTVSDILLPIQGEVALVLFLASFLGEDFHKVAMLHHNARLHHQPVSRELETWQDDRNWAVLSFDLAINRQANLQQWVLKSKLLELPCV